MLAEILEGLINSFGPIVTLTTERRELKDQALSSISNALTATYLYYDGLDRGNARNRDTEGMLAHYWAAVAIPMRHFNLELADRCARKSEYWINPERYSDQEIKALGIKLKDVKQAYERMRRPWTVREALHPLLTKRAEVKPAQKPKKKAPKKGTPKRKS